MSFLEQILIWCPERAQRIHKQPVFTLFAYRERFYPSVTHKSVVYATKMASEYYDEVDLNEPGLIYIIQEASSNNFKVGVSNNENNLAQRIRNLQSGNWRKLTLKKKYQVSNMKLAENDAHHTLRDVQIREGGGQEWFRSDFQRIDAAVAAAARKYPR